MAEPSYQAYMELMASESSELLVLSIQHESAQAHWYPCSSARIHSPRIFGDNSGSSRGFASLRRHRSLMARSSWNVCSSSSHSCSLFLVARSCPTVCPSRQQSPSVYDYNYTIGLDSASTSFPTPTPAPVQTLSSGILPFHHFHLSIIR